MCVPVSTMQEWMEKTDEAARKEQMDKMMQDWETWSQKNKDAILDQGYPVGKTKRVTADGVSDIRNDLNYIMMVQADSPEAAAEMFKDNPHLAIPNSYIDISESSHPGM